MLPSGFLMRRTKMTRRADRARSLRSRRASEWRDAGDEEDSWWYRRPAEETWQDEEPRESLAHRLERDQRLMGRVVHWLLIKGGMVVLMLVGLIVLGLVGGFL